MADPERTDYKGWQNCLRLSNDHLDVIVTTDVGPRIIRFGFVDDVNEFREYEDQLGKTGGDEWRIYGGHRFWHAPEAQPRTYYPDNAPVEVEQHADFVRLIQPTEPTTGMRKEIDFRLSPDEPHLQLTHRLTNTGLWPVELAPWALSVMAQGGTAIIPLPPRGPHPENLLPTSTLTLWAFTDMADPRWTWGRKYVLLRQDPALSEPQKVGVSVPDGWAAYARDGHLFVKTFTHQPDVTYPDFGCSFETFTNGDMLEVETLGPLATVAPGASVEHVEHWFLFRNVQMPANDDEVDRDVLPRVQVIKQP